MEYEYLPIEQVIAGDVIERVTDPINEDYCTKGKLYIVKDTNPGSVNPILYTRDNGEEQWVNNKHWKLIKTKPGSEAKKGDSVICLEDIDKHSGFQSVFHNIPRDCDTTENYASLSFKDGYSWQHESFKVLCRKETTAIKTITKPKEKTMNDTTCKKPKTDLQKEIKQPFMAKIFSENGTYKSKLNAKSLKALNKLIAKHMSHNQFDTIKTLKTIETTTAKAQPLVKTKV